MVYYAEEWRPGKNYRLSIQADTFTDPLGVGVHVITGQLLSSLVFNALEATALASETW
jgi:hypothetical protein